MRQRIDVTLLPDLVSSAAFQGRTAVVIDVLRATTTIVTALAHGARCVIPCLEIGEARESAQRMDDSLLGGERGGQKIGGFDLGNSPAEYTRERVQGKAIAFTTTNGTRAMRLCHQADQVLMGAFVNLSALCDALHTSPAIGLLCAGTNGQVTREDTLLAGAVVFERIQGARFAPVLNDQAKIAYAAWLEAQSLFSAGTPLAESLRDSNGGRHLIEIGLEQDIEIAGSMDRFECVPRLKSDGKIEL